MLQPAKGEMSAGLIIGIVLMIAIIIGLIIWSQSNKSDDMTPTDDVGMMENTSTDSTSQNTTQSTTTTTTTTITTPANDPTLPQTGMGPEAK